MKLLLTVQKLSKRGQTWAVRILGTQYIFAWHDALNCYAMPVADTAKANRLLEGLVSQRMFAPGLAVLDDSGKPVPTIVEPQPAAAVVPVAAQAAPEAPKAEEPVSEPAETVQYTHKHNTKKGKK